MKYFDTTSVIGIIALAILLSLIIKYYQQIDKTISDLSPEVGQFTQLLSGQ